MGRTLQLALIVLLGLPSLATSQSDTFSAVAHWVVAVYQMEGKNVSVGSGFIDGNGYVITAAHIILQSKQPAFVSRQGKLTADALRSARVLRINRDSDIAILDAGFEPSGLRFQEFPSSSGDEVWVFGYEFPKSAAILRMSRASIGQRFQDFFQLDGAVQQGFSGGPITTRGGRVVGIIAFGSRRNPNLAYLIPAHVLIAELGKLPPRNQAALSTPTPEPIYTPPPSTPVPPTRPTARVDDHRILPGDRVGPIRLGMSLGEASLAMGRNYDETGSGTGGATYYAWTLDRQFYTSLFSLPQIVAWGDTSGIFQIDASATQFRTPNGNGVGSSADSFVREFGNTTYQATNAPGDLVWRFGTAGLSIFFWERNRVVYRVLVRPRDQTFSSQLRGNWAGVWASSIVSQGGTFVASIAQEGGNLSGTVALGGSPCFGAFQAIGTATSDSFSLNLSAAGATRAVLIGRQSADTFQGSYVVLMTGTRCDGDRGTVNATRR